MRPPHTTSRPLRPNVTSSIIPEVHNVVQCRQRRTEPQPQGIDTQFREGHSSDVLADRQTDGHTVRQVDHNTPQCYRGRVIILAPLMLSHLLVHLPPRPSRSQIALFSMPRVISGIDFLFDFMNQFHLFMLISNHPSVLHFLHPSPLHSFTLNSKLTFLINPFCHRFLTNHHRYFGLTSSAIRTVFFRFYSAHWFSFFLLLRQTKL